MKTKKSTFKLIATMLLGAVLFASCSSDDPAVVVDKSGLITAIAAANNLLATTSEGVAAGNYLKGSQADLNSAITAAQSVIDDAAATQITVTNATVALAAAVEVYNGQIVVPIDPTNLVGQWTFDEITAASVGAVVKDYSGNGFDGSITKGHDYWGGGTPTLTEDRYGVAGKALHFNEGGNVEIPYNTALNPSKISISLWMKQDVNNPIVNNQYMIAMNRWNCYKFNMQDVPKPFFTVNPAENPGSHINQDSADPVAGLTQGAWYHLVVTFGDGHMIFYVDGVQTKDWIHDATILSISGTPINLVFGQDLPTDGYSLIDTDPNYLNWGGFFIGTLDEIRIYKTALSASQVTSIYEVEKP